MFSTPHPTFLGKIAARNKNLLQGINDHWFWQGNSGRQPPGSGSEQACPSSDLVTSTPAKEMKTRKIQKEH
jgi:hypothetical protein